MKAGRKPKKIANDAASIITNNDLLDISKSPEKLTGAEEIFYKDQKTTRICRLSEHVDKEYEKEREAACKKAEDEKARSMQLEEFMNPVEFQEVVVSPHPRRPWPVLLDTTEATLTTPPPSTPLLVTPKPSVRKI